MLTALSIAHAARHRRPIVTRPFGFVLAAVFGLALLETSALAINIIIEYEADESYPPPYDPDGSKLVALANAAAELWEDYLPQNGTFTIDLRYTDDDLDLFNPFGRHDSSFDTGADNNIYVFPRGAFNSPYFGITSPWFIDETPLNHSEFDFSTRQRIDAPHTGGYEYIAGRWAYRDVDPAERAQWFAGSPPDLMEIGYRGVTSNQTLAGQYDLFTFLVMWIGEELTVDDGPPWTSLPQWTNGQSVEFISTHDGDIVLDDRMRLHARPALFLHQTDFYWTSNLTIPPVGTRVLPSAIDIMTVADAQNFTVIDLPRKDFTKTTGSWQVAGNWLGNAVPEIDDEAFIGRPSSAGSSTVTLNANTQVLGVNVSSGATLYTNAYLLNVGNTATISGANSYLIIDPGGELVAARAIVQDSARIYLANNAEVNVSTLDIRANSQLNASGAGTMNVFVGVRLNNDGAIIAGDGAHLVFSAPSGNRWNLDGESGDGVINASSGNITFNTGSLVDPFSGTMHIGANRQITFGQNWQSDGVINLNGGTTAATSARIRGSQAQFQGGTINVSQNAEIGVYSIFSNNVQVNLSAASSRLTVGYDDDNFPASISLSGANFSGPGTLNLLGNVTATSGTTSTINVGSFDWDGTSGDTTTTVQSNAILNVRGAINDAHDGQIALNGGTLDVDTAAAWTMAGNLQFTNGGRLTGTARANLSGSTNLTGQNNRIESPVRFTSGSVTYVAGELEIVGATEYQGGSYYGNGTIRQDGVANVTATTSIGTNFGHYAAPGLVNPPLYLQHFDWDGVSGSSTTNIASGVTLTINAVQIDDTPTTDGHDGTINVNGGTVIVNTGTRIVPPFSPSTPVGTVVPVNVVPTPWRLDGTLNLAQTSGSAAVVTSAYGSAMQIHGAVNATAGQSAILIGLLQTGGTIRTHNTAQLTMNSLDFSGGNILVDSGGTLRLLSARFRPASNVTANGDVELTSTAQFDGGGSYTGTGNLRLQAAATFNGSTTFDVRARFEAGSNTTIASGRLLSLGRGGHVTPTAQFSGAGELQNLSGSTLYVHSGANVGVKLVNQGTLELGEGASLAAATVALFNQSTTGRINLDVTGAAAGMYDTLHVNGAAQLGGQFQLFFGSYIPTPGSVFTILTAGSVTGVFENAADGQRVAFNRGSFLVDYSSTAVTLSDFLPGDYNLNGVVDAADYVVWRDRPNLFGGDPGGYNIWRANFGLTAGSSSGASLAVPEPSGALMAICLIAWLSCWRRCTPLQVRR